MEDCHLLLGWNMGNRGLGVSIEIHEYKLSDSCVDIVSAVSFDKSQKDLFFFCFLCITPRGLLRIRKMLEKSGNYPPFFHSKTIRSLIY